MPVYLGVSTREGEKKHNYLSALPAHSMVLLVSLHTLIMKREEMALFLQRGEV